MAEVGIRALKQNASSVVASAVAGEVITITDRGRPVAKLTQLPVSPLEGMVESGRARRATTDLADVPAPEPGPDGSQDLSDMRDAERY